MYCTQTQSRTRSCRGNTGSSPALITLIIINSIQYSVPSSLQQYTIIIIIFTIISLYRHYHYQQRHHHPYNHWHHHERQHHHYCIHCQHFRHHHQLQQQHHRVGNLLICSFAQIKWATVSDLFRSFRTNERLWANPSGCNAHVKRVTMSDSLRSLMINEWISRGCLTKNCSFVLSLTKKSDLLKKIWLKS